MIILDPYWKIKRAAKFAGIFVLIAAVLALVFAGINKTKQQAQLETLGGQKREAKSAEDKQKAMLEAINEANQGAKNSSAVPTDEQNKKQQEMQDAISKTNSQTQPISREESTRRAQDMFNEINKANKK